MHSASASMRVALLPFLEVDVAVVPLVFLDLPRPRLVGLLGIRPIGLLTRIVLRRLSGIFAVWFFTHATPTQIQPLRSEIAAAKKKAALSSGRQTANPKHR